MAPTEEAAADAEGVAERNAAPERQEDGEEGEEGALANDVSTAPDDRCVCVRVCV